MKLLLFFTLIIVLSLAACSNPSSTVSNSKNVVVVSTPSGSPTMIQNQTQTPQKTPAPKETPKEVVEVLQSIKKFEKQGREMQSLRESSDLKKISQCGDLMRKYQKEVADLEPKAEKLPKLYSTFLHPAVIELKMCVTCGTGAIASCDRASENIRDLEKRLLEQ